MNAPLGSRALDTDQRDMRTSDERASLSVRVTEIFRSLQGEGRFTGLPTCFVRLTGCPLRCHYCDTAYAFHGGSKKSIGEIVNEVAESCLRHVCVTGGEPLAQAHCRPLLTALADAGHAVSIETSGAIDFSGLDPRIVRVVDVKTPGSGEAHRQRWECLDALGEHDQIKFVITSRSDYEWAIDICTRKLVGCAAEILFSPAVPALSPTDLADWIVADAPPVRFQIQLHKALWGDTPGH